MQSNSINTQGGSIISGDVNAGTFIGRDQIIVLSGYTAEQLEQVLPRLREVIGPGQARFETDIARQRLTVAAPGAAPITLSAQAAQDLLPIAARRPDERTYLDALLVNPRYGRWATQFVPLAGMLTSVERPPGWADIPPEFTLLEMMGEGAQRQVRRVHLDDITQAIARYPALALLGEPGAGKTTTLYKLAWDAAYQRATGQPGPLPLVAPLADYRDYATPFDFVQAVWKQATGATDLVDRLRQGDLLLLFDALNEMPFRDERNYRERIAAWRRFVDEWPGNHMVFSGRSRDYNAIEPLGLPQVEIERLDDNRVRDFMRRYVPDQADQAWEKLKDSPLLELVRNPYYLFMLAYILAERGEWPAGRAGLFERFVSLLVCREQTRHHPDWCGEKALRKALALLAESIQPLGQGTRLPRSEWLKRTPTQVECEGAPVDTPPQAVLRLGLAAMLLDAERSAGGEEQVRFYHHQLQEYFAARALLERFQAGHDLSARWRQPRLARDMPDPGQLGDWEPLPPPPTTGWEEPTIMAAGLAPDLTAFVQAVQKVNPALAARCLIEAGLEPPPDLKTAVQSDLLREMSDPRVHVRARIAAGEALGRLGDPRFQVIQVKGYRILVPPLVRIPAGPAHIGSSWWHVLWLALRGFPIAQTELPRHTLDLPEFYIGQFPITNAEYACFIEAGGYRQERYWPRAALAWLRGEAVESGAVKEAMDIVRAVRQNPALLQRLRRAGYSPQYIAALEQLSQMDEAQVQALIGKEYAGRRRDQPAFWQDARFNNPSQPVVGVTWYEAVAYCNWLTAQLQSAIRNPQSPIPNTQYPTPNTQWIVRLPTEAEWEKAARGDKGWLYPWGNRWQAGRANTLEAHVLRTTPVGIYPHGASLSGLHDMIGNVWEWTASLGKPYPHRPDDDRNNPEAEGYRVVRGGAWRNDRIRARCACRSRGIPDNWLVNVGFRVVVSLAFS